MWNICHFNKVIMVPAGFFEKVTTEIAVIWLKGGQFIKGSVLHDTNNGKGERKNRENEESEKRLNEKKKKKTIDSLFLYWLLLTFWRKRSILAVTFWFIIMIIIIMTIIIFMMMMVIVTIHCCYNFSSAELQLKNIIFKSLKYPHTKTLKILISGLAVHWLSHCDVNIFFHPQLSSFWPTLVLYTTVF